MKLMKFAIKIADSNQNELAQRIGYSFGYRWISQLDNFSVVPLEQGEWLIFHPEEKGFTWLDKCGGKAYLDINCIPIAVDLPSLLWYFNNEMHVIDNNIVLTKDGSVSFRGRDLVISNDQMNRIIAMREEIIKKK